MKETVLVVGGAGYIGSHMVKMLLAHGYACVILDNLSTGYREAVLGGTFLLGDLADRALLQQVLREHRVQAVMHFASFIQVGESVERPDKYYGNNLINTIHLLDAMVAEGIKPLIFSSSAAVYGEPEQSPIDEHHRKNPINPYGRSKWMVEQILEDYDRAYGLRSVCLRYFNAAGADPEGLLGERHQPETHLIPLVLQAINGRRPAITVFGQDYDTPDGSCLRDYIHVVDLCQAHLLALQHLLADGRSKSYNLGNGQGFSVLEVIETAAQVTGRAVPIQHGPRRPGDPARLVAEAGLAQQELGWQPVYADLATIMAHAWQWERILQGRSGAQNL